MNTRVALLVIACAMPSSDVRANDPPRPTRRASRSGMVRIDASGCPSKPRRGSGFAWNDAGTIVTALHVVVGCTNIGVRYPVGGGQYQQARVTRTLRDQDLAMLTVAGAPASVTPLAVSATPPAAGATMVAWGYPVAVRGLLDTELKRRRTTGTLDDLVNESVRKQVASVGMPNLSSPVIFLEGGHLLPGHSGAPIVDANEQVVGIADGGLERGAVEISWAIPATQLAALAASRESPVTGGANSDVLFAADLVEPSDVTTFDVNLTQTRTVMAQVVRNVPSYSCGPATFTKARTRTSAELMQTADDYLGLQQLIASSGMFSQPTDLYDIWQDLTTGATVVTPAGSPMHTNRGYCVFDVIGRAPMVQLQQVIKVVVAPTVIDADRAARQYELELTATLGAGWQIDPQWTYRMPMTRPDGGVVSRKGNMQLAMTPQGPFPVRYAFESLTAKGGYFMGVTAIVSDNSPALAAAKQRCLYDARYPDCPAILAAMRLAAQSSIATHLSTFPVS